MNVLNARSPVAGRGLKSWLQHHSLGTDRPSGLVRVSGGETRAGGIPASAVVLIGTN